MKKLLVFAVLLLSGCVSDLTKYPHYDVPAPAEKARLYIPDEYARDSKTVKKVMQKYFLPAFSKQNADFIVKHEKTSDLGIGTAAYFFSALTLWILPTWETEEGRLSFSLTEVDSGRKIDLSDVNIKERYYFSWLLSPMLFSSKIYFAASDRVYFSYASAIEEAASLIYNPNSRLYQEQKKWLAPNTPVKEKNVEKPQEKNPSPASAPAPVQPAPATPEDLDMLW
ncbi:MAG: hypothetical protein IJ846_01120 [Alphaproteobacteria bacterium]|nr:hypothetical protein [Alphaproteobacteria bacterium]